MNVAEMIKKQLKEMGADGVMHNSGVCCCAGDPLACSRIVHCYPAKNDAGGEMRKMEDAPESVKRCCKTCESYRHKNGMCQLALRLIGTDKSFATCADCIEKGFPYWKEWK